MRKLLFIPEGSAKVSDEKVHRMFSASILVSAVRCLLAYIVLPIVTLALGVATSVGPDIGIPIGVVALAFDVVGIRRFWLANHQWRWQFTYIYVAIIALIMFLLVRDVITLAG